MYKFLSVTSLIAIISTSFAWSQSLDDFYYSKKAIDNFNIKRMQEISANDLEDYELFLRYRESDPEKAAQHAISFVNTLEYTEADTLIAEIYDYVARYYAKVRYKYKSAIFFQNHATDIYNKLNLPYKECMSEATSAKYNNHIGKYHIALNQTLSSLEKAQQTGNTLCMRACYLNLGFTYYNCKERDMSIGYYKKVANSSEGPEEDFQRVVALNNLLPYTFSMKERDSIIHVALDLCDKNKFNSVKCLVFLNYSLTHLKDSNLVTCDRMLDSALAHAITFRDTGFYHTNRASYFLEKKDTLQALDHFNKAIDCLSQGEFDDEIKYILFFMQNLYAEKGNTEKAYEALVQYHNIENRQGRDESIKEIFKMQKRIDIEKLKQKAYSDRTRIRTISMSMIILLLLIILILFYIYSKRNGELKANKAHQEKIQQDLKSKNDLINLKRLQQYQENTFIDKIIKQLNDISNKTASAAIRSELNTMTRQLNQSKDKSDWTEVEKSLQDFNTDFYNNLIREYPQLTPNDRRLCSLIHMNMSTKEIAAITHQSVGSINTARTRLRKKLNITGDDMSLITFLDQFN